MWEKQDGGREQIVRYKNVSRLILTNFSNICTFYHSLLFFVIKSQILKTDEKNDGVNCSILCTGGINR